MYQVLVTKDTNTGIVFTRQQISPKVEWIQVDDNKLTTNTLSMLLAMSAQKNKQLICRYLKPIVDERIKGLTS